MRIWMTVKRKAMVAALGALALSLALVVSACGSSSSGNETGSDESGDITLGAVLSQSGPASIYGVEQSNGMQLYLGKVNEAGGVGGREIKLTVRDDRSEPTEAATQMQQLIGGSALAVAGPTEPPSLELMARLAEQQMIPLISFALSSDVESPWWFRAAWSDEETVDAVIKHMKQLGITKVAVLYPDESGGQEGMEAINELAPKSGVTIVASESYPGETTDPTVQIQKVASAKPEGYIVWDSSNTSRLALVVKTLRAHGATEPIGAPEAAAAAGFLETAGDAAEGVYYWGAFAVDDPTPAQIPAVKEWKEKYGEPPNDTDLAGYAQAQILVAAIESLVQSSKPLNRENMRDAMEELTGLHTVYGTVNYSASNHDDPFGPVPLIEYSPKGTVRVAN